MNMPMQWRRAPKPDEAVTDLTTAIDNAARKGQIRCLCVITLDPTLEIEYHCAGDLDEVRRNLLIAGLTRLIQKLAN